MRSRFFRRLTSLTDSLAQHLCSVSYEDEMAFAAVIGPRESERIVATACYYVDPSTGLADTAYLVDPEWQGAGLGTVLARSDRRVRAGARRSRTHGGRPGLERGDAPRPPGGATTSSRAGSSTAATS